MSIQIRYTNLGLEITPQQAALLTEYDKVYVWPDGLTKREESYQNNQLTEVNYYKDATESEDDALAILMPLNVSFGIRSRQSYGAYTIIDENSYYQNKFSKKWKWILDARGRSICVEEIDINTDIPMPQYTFKFLGEYVNEQSVDYCKFHYNEDGRFWFCEYNYFDEYDNDEFDLARLPWIKDRFQLSDNMYNYYLSSELLPPL